MDYTDLQQRLNAAVERYDSQTFLGSFRDTTRSSLLNAGLSTRANSLWKMAEFVVAKKDAGSPDGASSGYLVGWRTLASNYNNQTLLLEVSDNEWEAYDAQGVKLGGEEYIKDILEKRSLKKQHAQATVCKGTPKQLQKIVYGAPGTGKSFRLNTDTADDENVFRVTFHPDSDYASFVGAYKPTMDAVPRVAMNGTQVKLATFDPAIGADELAKIKSEKRVAYEFAPQAFMNAYVAAWTNWANAEVEKVGGGGDGTAKPVFLIIEEINRGNCAQVFGDIFQLLDRSDAGWSTYPILADRDLGTWLNEKHFGTAAFASLANVSAPDKIKSSDWEEVRKGKMLLLPPNLYIWATMNTSDQSLFPIDSAFKRRWDWEYVPIREGAFKDGPKQGQKMAWKIQVGASHYDWWKFLKNVNQRIFKITESEDKELGYFFVKPDGKTNPQGTENDQISSKRFVGKVIFYLWNDVFKDYGIETIFKASDAGGKSGEDAKGVAFQSFFKEDDDQVDEKVLESFFKQLELKSDEEIAAAKAATAAAVQVNAVPAAAAATPAQPATGTPTATALQGV